MVGGAGRRKLPLGSYVKKPYHATFTGKVLPKSGVLETRYHFLVGFCVQKKAHGISRQFPNVIIALMMIKLSSANVASLQGR